MKPFTNRARQDARGLFFISVFFFAQYFSATTATATCPAPPGSNKIVVENCQAGNPQSEWNITGTGDAAIQGYATDISFTPGQTVQFKITTTASAYHIDIYRLGWYNGNGARKVDTIPNANTTKTSQPACLNDETTSGTHIRDCGNWSVSASWVIPGTATSGIYIARPVREDDASPHGASHIVFIVRDDTGHSDILFQTSDTTWQAYNRYGGTSLYYPAARAYKVSYNRPFTTADNNPESWLFGPDYPMVRFIEQNGYDVSYFSGMDTDRFGSELLEHKVFMTVGHDEYWSGQQRTNLETAINSGVNAAFFTGNDMFWKTRWENNYTPTGFNGPNAYRTLVCYKETEANAKIDPLPGVWTGTWRDARFGPHDGGRPENAVTGSLYEVNRDGTSTLEIPSGEGALRFWRNTGASVGIILPSGVLGYEWNEDVDNGLRPAGQIRLSKTVRSGMQYLQNYGTNGNIYVNATATHRMTLHRASSGALVFDAGTVQWTWGLDNDHNPGVGTAAQIPPPDVRVQQATANLLSDMGAQPQSIMAGLVLPTPSADTTPPTSTITFPTAGSTLPSGTQIAITGTAVDAGGGVVGGVEVSLDGGTTWHPAIGRESWSYKWTPTGPGTSVTIRSRAADDSLRLETPSSGVTVNIGAAAAISCPCSLFAPSETVGPDSNDGAAVNLGVKFRSDINGFITAIRFYKHPGNTGTHTGYIWTAPATGNGTKLATVTFSSESGSGWQQATLASPLAITAGTTYIVSYYTTAGHYAASVSYFDGVGVDKPPLHALAENVQGPDGVFAYGSAGLYPSSTYGYSNYWVDVVFNTTASDTTPPTVSSTSPLNGDTGISVNNNITATFSEAMTASTISGSTFFLKDSSNNLVPASVTYSAATLTATLDPSSALAFNQTYTATVKGGSSGAKDLAGNALAADYTFTFTTTGNYTCPCSLWDLSTAAGIGGTDSNDTNATNLGLRFRSDVNGYITRIRFFKQAGNTGTTTGSLYTNSGTLLASATFAATGGATGWQEVNFTTPVAITANTTYVAAYHTTAGHFGASRPYFGSAYVNGPLRGLANNFDGPNGSYHYSPTPSFPSDNPGDAPNYWVDVVFNTTVGDTTPPVVNSKFPAPGATIVARDINVNATFNETLDATTVNSSTFQLRDAGNNLVTATVSYDSGTNIVTLAPSTLLNFNTTYTATLTGGASGIKDVAGNALASDVSWTFTTIKAAPTFTAGNNFTLLEDSGAYSQTWATNIVGGPVTFDVQIEHPELFQIDPAISPSGVLTFTPMPNAYGTSNVTATAINNEGTGSTPATFTITLTAVNDVPSFTRDGDITVNEDSGPYSALWASNISAGPNESSQTLTFVVTNDNPSLFSSQPAISAITGFLNFTPAPNAFGTVTVTVRLQDDGGTANGGIDRTSDQTFIIRIVAVNDPPQFTAGGDVSVLEDSEGYSAAWATGVAPGPPNEAGTVSFSLTNNNNTLFAVQPAISPSGTLTFTTASNAFGTATVTVVATDNDGASAAPLTFTITITGVNDAPTFTAGTNITIMEDSGPYSAAWATAVNAGPNEGSQTVSFIVTDNNNALFAVQPAISSNGVLTFTPAPDANGSATVTVTLHDDGGTANGGVNSSAPQTFTINVTAVNDPPRFTAGGNVTADEDSAPYSAVWATAVSGGPVDESQAVSFAVSNDNNALFSVQPAISPTGVLTFTLTANANGVAHVSVTASDTEGATTGPVSFTITVNAINDPPVAANDAYSVDEDTPLTISAPGVLGNDTDTENSALTAVLVAGPSHGTLTLNANGSFTYTPAANYNGADSFTYKANDGAADSNVATVNITINSVNDAPVAVNDSYSTNEDTARTVAAPGVLGNDTDADGDALTAILVTGPAHGALTLNANGSFTYTPAANYNGSDSFTYKANDGTANSSVATVNITINPVNDPPVAANDSYSTNEDTVLNIAATGVLGNDIDVDGDALTAILVTGPTHGTVTLNANGSFTYTPGANYNGSDSFTYKANDSTADSNVATVNITVVSVNDPPVANNDGPYTIIQGGTLNAAAPGLLANDTDIDSASLTAIKVSNPAHGSVTVNADGSFSYVHDGSDTFSDSFTYKANDGTDDSNVATVNITLTPSNHAPVATNDSYTVAESGTLNAAAPGVLGNDTDVDAGNILTAIKLSNPTHGTLTFNADGSFTYVHDGSETTTDSFIYKANDGKVDSNVATVTITITPVNDPPVAGNDAYSVNEDTPLTISAPGVLGNDTDAENSALTAVLVAGPSHGTLTLNANGSFTYTPAANYNGGDSFTYKANDGAADSNVATVNITINSVNDAPVAVNDSYTTNEDTALTVAAPGVLGNDTDADGDALTAILVTGPAHGALTLNANGSFTYTPVANYNGGDSFTYKANDGTINSANATVSITITAVNDPPVAVNDAYSVNEDTTLNIAAPGLLGNDTDVEGSALTAAVVTGPDHGTLTLNANGSFTYTPAANYNGSDSFTYKANDGTADSNVASVNITINAVNDAPVAVNDSYTTNEDTPLNVAAPGMLGNDTDADGDPLTAALVTGPTHGTLTLNANGSFAYTPAANYNGSDSFTYRANDGTVNSANATVSLTVTAVNDPPVAVNDAYSMNEDATLTINAPGVLGNDTDVEGSALTAAVVAGPGHGTLTLNANGSFTYAPAANYFGTDTFTYKANDGAADSSAATVTITIANVNDAPVAVADAYSTNEDTALNVSAPGVLTNDTDVDGNTITAVLVTTTTHGTLTLSTNGSFVYTPAANYNGTDQFTYHANDGLVNSGDVTVTITINPVNDPPTVVGDNSNTYENLSVKIVVLANDSDVDGDTLTVSAVTPGAHGSVAINADNSVQYTPNLNYNGTDAFTYTASDGHGGTGTATVNVTIKAVNSAPIANPDTYNTNEDTPLTVPAPGVLGNDTDPEGDPLTAALTANVSHGSLTFNTDGSFSYTPAANYNGVDTFKYRAKDSGLVTSTDDTTMDFLAGTVDGCTAVRLGNGDVMLTPASPGMVEAFSGTALPSGWTSNIPTGATLTVGSGVLTVNGSTARFETQYQPAAGQPKVVEFVATFATATGNQNVGFGTGNANQVLTASNQDWVMFSTNTGDQLYARTKNGGTRTDLGLGATYLGAAHRYRIEWSTTDVKYYIDGVLKATHTPNTGNMRFAANDDTVGGNTLTVDWLRIGPYTTPCTFTSRVFFGDGGTWQTLSATMNLPSDTTSIGWETRTGNVENPDASWSPWTAVSGTSPNFTITSPNAKYLQYRASLSTTDGSSPTIERVDVSAVLPISEATVTINVNPIDDAPAAVNDAYTTAEDTPLTVAAPGVLSNDTDIDGPSLSAVLVANAQHGSVTLNANGSFTYTPALNYNGPDSFTYKANDGTLDSNVATVTIAVTAVDDAPVASNDSYSTNEDTTLTIAAPGVLSNDSDAEGDAMTAVLVTNTANGTLALNANGSFTYTPNANYNGSDSFTYKVVANGLQSSAATVTITVNPVNDPPVAVADTATTDEDVPATGNVLTNDTDPDSATPALTAIKVSDPAHGSVILNSTGQFTYTPAADFNGTDSFTYKANDGVADSNVATVTITINPVNDAPVAHNDAYTTAEDTALTVPANGVLSNDTDVDSPSLTAVLVTGPSHGTLSLNSNGSFTYMPNANYNGTDSFTYKASDGALQSSAATVTITITPVNDAPVANGDSYATNEDTALTVASPGVVGNDTDVDGDSLTAVLASGPSHGTLTLNSNGSFTYTPGANYNGPDSFTYKANDGAADSNVATVAIMVNAVNDPPVAADDTYSTNEDTAVTIVAPGVLGNDTDVDSPTLTAVIATNPSHGTVTLNADGSFTYTPAANYNGPDSFTYKTSDGAALSLPATVSITVNPVNDAPVAGNDTYSTDEETTLSIAAPGILGNDTDVDGNSLTVAVVTSPAHGSLTLNPNGSFTYTPELNFNGTDSFTYKANDGSADSNVATVTITVNGVNDAPVATDDGYNTNEDTALSIAAPGVLSNDSDIDSPSLTAILVNGPTHGTLTLNSNGSFTYTPALNYNGTDSFTYKANDGSADSNVATVTITVNAVNDAPVANGDTYSVNEDETLHVAAPGVLGNDTDVDSSTRTAILVSGPSHGSLTLNNDGSFTYTPAANYNGPDSFTYKANDGALDSNVATVGITVNSVDDPPMAANDAYSTNEDTPLNVTAPGVLANDSDIDSPSLTAVLVMGPSHGTLSLNSNGSFTYTPAGNYNGPDSFTYKASDGSLDSNVATVAITVNAVNDAPVAANDAYTTNEDTALNVSAPGVLGNDNDVDSPSLTAVLVSGPSHGSVTLNSDGSFAYTPASNFNGTDSFTYKANDGSLDSSNATVTITVNPVNDAPVAVNDAYSTNEDTPLNISAAGVLANDTDVDGPALTAILVAGPTHGTLTLNANGSFTYTPEAEYNGSDSFTYKANDGSLDSNVATVSITVNAVNDPPVAANDAYSTDEDTPLTVAAPGVLGNDHDVDSPSLTTVTVAGPSHGTLILNSNGSFTYTPAANYNGSDSFTYKANDGSADSNVATVAITVNAVNDAPVAVADSYNVNEDATLTVAAPGVLGNDTDVESSPLTASLVSGPTHGTLSLNTDGSFTYTPTANYNGSDSFTYKASDGSLQSNIATVTIAVAPVNDPPVAQNDSVITNEDTEINITVLTNDTDVDGDVLHVSMVSAASHGTVVINPDTTTVKYTPTLNFNGSDSFTYTITDGHGGTATATVSVTVNPVNDPPVAQNDIASTNEDTAVDVLVLANDTDVDGDALTITAVGLPSHGSAVINPGAASVKYTPAANYNGTDAFTYTISDGHGGTASATVTVAIAPVNDPPAASNDSYTTNEDTALTVAAPGVLANDVDVDSSLTAVLVSGPGHGSLALNPDGSFIYTPAANYNGTDSFTYKANDGSLDSNVATVSLTINAVNDPPVAANDSYSTNEDVPLNVVAPGVLSNDSDVDSPSLTAVLVTGPSHGSLTLNSDGSFTYTPAANYNGSDSFTYKASDGAANSNIATVSISIAAVPDPPVAVNDTYVTNEDTPLNVTIASGVLANDSDPDGDPITAALVTGPTHGTLTLNANGSFVYTPNANYFGTDSFTYRANDGTSNSNNATVTITINSVNDPPVATNDSYNAQQNTPLTVAAPGVLANDTDVEGSPLTAVQVAPPAHGSLTLNATGGFSYTPTAGYSGADSFTYKANDGLDLSNVATVSINVIAMNIDTTAADFNQGTTDCSVVTATGDGEVILKGLVSQDFSGAALPAGWSQTATGGAATVSAGMLNVDGARVYTDASYSSGRSIEFVATFGAAQNQAAGFAQNLGAGEPWLIFGTANTTNTLYARVNTGSGSVDTAIAGNWIGTSHKFRIDWSASQAVFMIDDIAVLTSSTAVGGTMRPVFSDATAAGPQLVVDWVHAGQTQCTFTSRIFDGGAPTQWKDLAVTIGLQDGVTFNASTRTGDGSSWSPWTAVTGRSIGSAVNRYIQYQIVLSTFAIGVGPEVRQVAINPSDTPLVSISDVTVAEGNSGTSNATFTVSLSASSTQTVTVNYATANGSATSGSDFVAASGTLTFAPGDISKPVTVVINGDTQYEDDEKFFVNLTGATNAVIADPQGVGTITNDDAQPTVSAGTVSVAEGNSGTTSATFNVTLSAPSGKPVKVNYATADGSAVAGEDYVATSGMLIFPAGTTSQSVTVLVNGDTKYETDETFNLNLSGAMNATLGSNGIGTISNDDGQTTISINNVSKAEGNSGTTPFVFTVTLSNPSYQTITVGYFTSNQTAVAPGDYTTTSGTLTFNPGDTTKTITVNVIGDTTKENNETFAVNLQNAVNATIQLVGGFPMKGTGQILNDD
jgi:VCBS repeat-containing protein